MTLLSPESSTVIARVCFLPSGEVRWQTLLCVLAASGLLAACGSAPLADRPVRDAPPRAVKTLPPPASVLPEPVAAPVAVRVESSEFVVLDENNVFFDSGATTVDERDQVKLRAYAERLKNDAKAYLTLIGHTDDLGSRNYNLALAEQRILAVSKLLQGYGVSGKQLRRYRGDSEKVPDSCKSAECRKKMRRVELVYSSK